VRRNGILLAMFLAATAQAQPAPETQAEVARLLDYLQHSGCRFQRNGSWHDPTEARAHLERKYRYLLDKGMVDRTEDFIARAATESSISGRPYLVRCGDGEPVPSAQWLGAELRRLRSE